MMVFFETTIIDIYNYDINGVEKMADKETSRAAIAEQSGDDTCVCCRIVYLI